MEIFCSCDDFCKNFEKEIETKLLPSTANSFKPKVPCGLAISEMMAIEMFYQFYTDDCLWASGESSWRLFAFIPASGRLKSRRTASLRLVLPDKSTLF